VAGKRQVGYGFAIYKQKLLVQHGKGAINPLSHVFDAEAIGAWRGLEAAIARNDGGQKPTIWLCIDSTSVIWCIRGDASVTSNWAFLACHDAMKKHNVRLRWAPGHMEIEGNEAADLLADEGSRMNPAPGTPEADPTASGLGTLFRQKRKEA
jgi:ribonuclease HI